MRFWGFYWTYAVCCFAMPKPARAYILSSPLLAAVTSLKPPKDCEEEDKYFWVVVGHCAWWLQHQSSFPVLVYFEFANLLNQIASSTRSIALLEQVFSLSTTSSWGHSECSLLHSHSGWSPFCSEIPALVVDSHSLLQLLENCLNCGKD
jgi:hypothetical protein